MMEKSFIELFNEALKTPFTGWGFSFIKDRIENEPLPRDYEKIVDKYITKSQTILDGNRRGRTIGKDYSKTY